MGGWKAISFKIHYFHALTMISKSSIQYQKGLNFLIEVSRKMTIQLLKLYGKSWPKSEQIIKKVTTPRTLEPLAFDEKSTFDILLSFTV